jgi:hypothetical protein
MISVDNNSDSFLSSLASTTRIAVRSGGAGAVVAPRKMLSVNISFEEQLSPAGVSVLSKLLKRISATGTARVAAFHLRMKPGLLCGIAAQTPNTKTINITVAEASRSVKNGCASRTFSPTWERDRKGLLSIAAIRTAITRKVIVDGPSGRYSLKIDE